LDKELQRFWPSKCCASFIRSWTTDQGESTKISCEKDNAMPAKKKQLQQSKKVHKPRQKTQLSLYIGMNIIVKGFYCCLVEF
jgi:hypothetical protein